MKAIKFQVPGADAQETEKKGFEFFVQELFIQNATFFKIGNVMYVVNDKRHKGLQSLLDFINVEPKSVTSLGEVELECDIQQKVKLL